MQQSRQMEIMQQKQNHFLPTVDKTQKEDGIDPNAIFEEMWVF